LNSALTKTAGREIGSLYLAGKDEEFATLEPGAGHRSKRIRDTWAGRYEYESATVDRPRFVVIFGCNAGGDFVHERDARHPLSRGVEEMHDVAAGYEETMRVAEFV
jgi:hypothetical protein